MSKKLPANRLASFLGQKGGVGKSALARLLAAAAAERGLRVLLADFDLEQLTCVEWNGTRLRRGVRPELDVRAFKSLKKLRKTEDYFDLIVADTRGLADGLTRDVAEESDVVFLPTGSSEDDLRPTLALAGALAKRGAQHKIAVIFSKVGRSERRLQRARERIRRAGFDLLAPQWTAREGFQAEFDAGRAGLDARNEALRLLAQDVSEALLVRALAADPRAQRQMDGATSR